MIDLTKISHTRAAAGLSMTVDLLQAADEGNLAPGASGLCEPDGCKARLAAGQDSGDD
jgi:hypothetical protein